MRASTPKQEKAADEAQADLNAAQREALAFKLRIQGYDFEEIATRCGYISDKGRPNASSAHKAWKRALARIPRQTIEEMRQTILSQQQAAIVAMQKRIEKGDTFAVAAMTNIHERQAKLFGLDTPMPDANVSQQPVRREYAIVRR